MGWLCRTSIVRETPFRKSKQLTLRKLSIAGPYTDAKLYVVTAETEDGKRIETKYFKHDELKEQFEKAAQFTIRNFKTREIFNKKFSKSDFRIELYFTKDTVVECC